MKKLRLVLYGNFEVDFTSETHHAKSLESLGHEVIKLQETEIDSPTVLEESLKSDGLIWIHSHAPRFERQTVPMETVLDKLKEKGIPTLAYHLDLYMPLPERWQQYINSPYMNHLQHFFTVDRLMADWLNENTKVKGHYLRAGVFEPECYVLEPDQEPLNDVIFVGSRNYHQEWMWRPQLIDWLKQTYGDRFKHYGGDGLDVVRGRELNQLYANTKVVVGDSLCPDFAYPDYWSDRVYETVGRGGFLLMPKIKGLETEFTEQELATFNFGDFDDLKKQIDFYLKNDLYRNVMRQRGFNQVKNNYTYKNRWQTILSEVFK